MQDFVSTPWTRVAGLAASTSVVGVLFIPRGFPWMGLVWVGLACVSALWLRLQSTRLLWPVLDAPAWALATSRPFALPVPKTVL